MNKTNQPFLSKADHAAIARGYEPKPASKKRGFRHAVPAYPKAPRREEERDRKRAMKDGSLRRVYLNGPPEPRDMAEGRSEQLGHSPNRAMEWVVHPSGVGRARVPRNKGLPRNSVWPEGKVAKPGRMG